LNNSIRILNFDQSVTRQSNLLAKFPNQIIDLTNLAPAGRLFASGAWRAKIKQAIPKTNLIAPTFLGSGDFHHISEILLEDCPGPCSLIVFDFHPDWDILPPHFGCGSWVTRVLKNKNILKCVLLGMGSNDLASGSLQFGNLAALKDNRLEIYPYRHKPGRVFLRKVPQGLSLKVKAGIFSKRIFWHELEHEDLEAFMRGLVKRLPEKKVYISIDKDCLRRDFALTNWEEGYLSLKQLLLMVKALKDNLEIIGLDITGDYSPVLINHMLKAMLSRLDHPRGAGAGADFLQRADQINEQTNLKILETLYS